jgi:ubiquinone/menaquinone biosynthesis C-methylase UbiE
MDDWSRYVIDDYDFVRFPVGARVLDIGCGDGVQLEELERRGAIGVGLEVDRKALADADRRGFAVMEAQAEQLPVRTSSLDGVICKGVIPYTHEPPAFREIFRVLKPNGIAHCCYLGAGYYLRYLLTGPGLGFRLYGLRTLLNSWLFGLTRRHLPGFLGDTVYQSRARLRRYYSELGLALREDQPSPTFLGFPVFIYHRLERTGRPT